MTEITTPGVFMRFVKLSLQLVPLLVSLQHERLYCFRSCPLPLVTGLTSVICSHLTHAMTMIPGVL